MRRLLFALLFLLILGGCEAKSISGGAPVTEQTSVMTTETFSIPSATDFGANRVFDMTPEYFRRYFNSISEIELLPVENCEKETLEACGHFENGAVRYIFKIIPEMQNSPSITLYTPVSCDNICEVTVDFDDHAFSTDAMALYKDICLDVMNMFSNIENSEELYGRLIEYADENVSTVNFLAHSDPEILYSDTNAAFCSYFAYGEYSHICVVPVH